MKFLGIPVGEERKYLKYIEKNPEDIGMRISYIEYLIKRNKNKEATEYYYQAKKYIDKNKDSLRIEQDKQRLNEIEKILGD